MSRLENDLAASIHEECIALAASLVTGRFQTEALEDQLLVSAHTTLWKSIVSTEWPLSHLSQRWVAHAKTGQR